MKKNGHGGWRPGAGRPKGSIERFTSQNLKNFRERYAITPLDHMLTILNAPPGTAGVTNERRDEMAKAAAPYLHPRLSAVEMSQTEEPHYSIDPTKLNDEELATMIRLTAKAQVRMLEDNGDTP